MGKVYAVGIGPGGREFFTEQAIAAIEKADKIVGFTTYIDIIRPMFPGKDMLSTPMKQEVQRCRMALEEAQKGQTIAMVCSGDAVVYGMAGLLHELAPEYPDVEVESVAGVTAALSGGALLGAPLTADFCVISLSDLLTPWELIEKRLHAAGMGDFCIALYNPMSKTRTENLRKACEILLKYKPENTVCGYVRQIGREGEEKKLLSLKELKDAEVDMFTTVFIGSANTILADNCMVTRRGYKKA